ncbi:MAG: hypothetical protein N3B10_02015 [Armatimonadetes bacterium]|nr:hypothetical protein [Armatimonadota bacterium]
MRQDLFGERSFCDLEGEAAAEPSLTILRLTGRFALPICNETYTLARSTRNAQRSTNLR